MKVEIVVRSIAGRRYPFVLMTHQAKEMKDLRLPVDFYQDVKLEFPHYEARIIDPVFLRGHTGKLNYHYSDVDGEPYVCYPGSITTEEKLIFVLSVWVVGQICVLTFDRYLNEMITEAGGSDKFLDWANQSHIHIIEKVIS